ncbi:MAG: hypothetical protein C0608_10845 [Deltaproteobacteria bacterium]|nr:MAG: hypothetical protein C0608_10845 [Deltaproteobacteria bacterium]
MGLSRENILLTGPPGSGKSALIKRLAVEFSDLGPRGFFIKERVTGTRRVGFELSAIDDSSISLSRQDTSFQNKTGRYDIENKILDDFIDNLELAKAPLVIIDEIGKLESTSRKLKTVITSILSSESVLLASIAKSGGGFIEALKDREDSSLYILDKKNHRGVFQGIISEVRSMLP